MGGGVTGAVAGDLARSDVSGVVDKFNEVTGRDKEESRALATRLFPGAELHLKKHADRSEALLMARWLWDTRFK